MAAEKLENDNLTVFIKQKGDDMVVPSLAGNGLGITKEVVKTTGCPIMDTIILAGVH